MQLLLCVLIVRKHWNAATENFVNDVMFKYNQLNEKLLDSKVLINHLNCISLVNCY